jgi:hypothetical protein
MTDTLPPPDEREAFEAWAKAFGFPFVERHPTAPHDCYSDHHLTYAWQGWSARAALPAAQPSDALLRELLEQRQEYERAGIHRSDFFFIETWARVAKRVPAPVAAQPTSGVRGPECALVCQEHKAGREACKLGACVRTSGVAPSPAPAEGLMLLVEKYGRACWGQGITEGGRTGSSTADKEMADELEQEIRAYACRLAAPAAPASDVAPCADTLAGCAPECGPHNRCTSGVPVSPNNQQEQPK